jgi:hypothetical protein
VSQKKNDGSRTYKEELRQRLTVLADGGWAEYVWEHDDSEVDEMMAAKDAANAEGKGLECPPDDWAYFFDDDTPSVDTTPQQHEHWQK